MYLINSLSKMIKKSPAIGLLLVSITCMTLVAEEAKQEEQKQDEQKKQTETSKNTIEESVLGMNVSGNRELPNVLYIIPWKGSFTGGKLPEITSLIDEVYEPVDPDVFAKQVDFYQQITETANEKE